MKKLTVVFFVYLITCSTALAQDCGCEGKPLPEVLSIVNGVKITAKDLDPDTHARVTELKRQVVEARKAELDLQINTRLLDAEAKKRTISSTKLLEEEVLKKITEPTEADARALYNEQKARLTGSEQLVEFDQVKDRIIAHLRSERRQEVAKKFAERLRVAADLKLLVDTATPPAKPSDRQRLFATFNNQQITSADIEDSLQPVIFKVQEQMYELRRRDLNRKINDVLLAQEAQKRHVTTRSLLDTEINSKVPVFTEAEAQKFYDTNKDKLNGAFTDLKQQILRHLQNKEKEKLQLAFADTLRKTAVIEDFLTPPEPKLAKQK
jgi:hypothetical protein